METLLPGTEVLARDLRWEVVLAQNLGDQSLYRLRGLEGVVKGRELDLLFPFESIRPIRHDLAPEQAAPLTNWRVYHQAFLLEQSLGPNGFLAFRPGRLDIQPYQLVPVLRAIRSSRVRLLLCDGVGLGKTIQAGLVLTELMARRLAHRVLVVSPAGPLLDQWLTEMRDRFSIRLQVLDRGQLEETRRASEIGANPFDSVALGIASIDFLKQEKILDQLERASYDLIIVDEAHHCFDLSHAQEREDSQRRRLAQVLARRCDALLLLTATPHDGNDRSFASLCELLDPSLIDSHGNLVGERFKRHVIRRLKGHIRDPHTCEPLFKERRVIPCPVESGDDAGGAFNRLMADLRALIGPELRRAFHTRQYSDVLSFIALLKRSVSTVAACRSTLMAVLERIDKQQEFQESKRQRLKTLRDYYRRLERFGPLSADEDREREALEAEDLAEHLADLDREIARDSRGIGRRRTIVEELRHLVELSNAALNADPKLSSLVMQIEEIRRNEPGANILVYTEYITSLEAAKPVLERLGQVMTMSGDDDDQTRGRVTNRFREQTGIILLSTDAASEGLNLHSQCHHLIHLELPFNPNRLEQRNGRIDRYGQLHDPVVRYLYLRNSFEERILLRLIAKYERQRARLNCMPNTLGLTTSTDASAERLLKGLLNEDTLPFQEQDPEFHLFDGRENEGADDATREILEAEDRVLGGFEIATRSNTWLGQDGIGAEPADLDQAESARELGGLVGPVDLAIFVRDAVLLEQGNIKGTISDSVFSLTLPPSWDHGLEEYPGYDHDSRQFRLTTDLTVMRDQSDRSVGFLGRAHPLVRIALERVRTLAFGTEAHHAQDIRVSAVAGPVPVPTLLFTFLGQVNRRSGRALERVLAIQVSQIGESRAYSVPEDWLQLTNGTRINLRDVWNNHFKAWASGDSQSAAELALAEFEPLATEFIQQQSEELRKELEYQDGWLADRSREIAVWTPPEAQQVGLFNDLTQARPVVVQDWMSATDPKLRLEGLSKDPSQPPTKRSEAEVALRVYSTRVKDLKSRLEFRPPEVIKLGMLMILPEVQHVS